MLNLKRGVDFDWNCIQAKSSKNILNVERPNSHTIKNTFDDIFLSCRVLGHNNIFHLLVRFKASFDIHLLPSKKFPLSLVD